MSFKLSLCPVYCSLSFGQLPPAFLSLPEIHPYQRFVFYTSPIIIINVNGKNFLFFTVANANRRLPLKNESIKNDKNKLA